MKNTSRKPLSVKDFGRSAQRRRKKIAKKEEDERSYGYKGKRD